MNVKQYKIVSYGRKYCWICRVAAEPEGGGAGAVCINGYQKEDGIANAFQEHFANIFVNSANEKVKVHQYNEMRLNYAGSIDKDM